MGMIQVDAWLPADLTLLARDTRRITFDRKIETADGGCMGELKQICV